MKSSKKILSWLQNKKKTIPYNTYRLFKNWNKITLPDPQTLYIPEKTRYFVILTPGHSGSVWLSKVLSSHPEVLCWHAGVVQRIFPLRYWQITDYDSIAWLYSIKYPSANHYRKIYKAIGDVGSISNPEIARLTDVRKHFYIYGLIRNGILFVRSQKQAFNEFEHIPQLLAREIHSYNTNAIKRFPSITKFRNKSQEIENFIYSCWRWTYYVETMEQTALKIYRIEDLNDVITATSMFKKVTALSTAPKDSIVSMLRKKINPHVKQKSSYNPKKVYFKKWNSNQRFIFETICGEKMRIFYNWQ